MRGVQGTPIVPWNFLELDTYNHLKNEGDQKLHGLQKGNDVFLCKGMHFTVLYFWPN